MMGRKSLVVVMVLTLIPALRGQAQNQAPPPGPTNLQSLDTEVNRKMAQGAMESMASEHLHVDAHMVFTKPRPQSPEDVKRAEEIVTTLKESIEQYKDYRVALAEGYRIFLPNIPQPMYHFTNYRYGYEAEFKFDPARPTSLLYRKTTDGYVLIGAMYTASRLATEDELNERVPLSVARWHAHVNICLPPRGQPGQLPDLTQFGPRGSISTEAECTAAGGRFLRQIFGWMVHVHPFEDNPGKIWRH